MSNVRIPDGFLDEIKARVRPSDVIGRKVKLTRRGKEWVGLSPFTNEKTPSFYVNDEKGIFKDFSSGLGGDIIKFLMETERLEFMEVVERLAEEAGMELPKASPESVEKYDRLKRLKAACSASAAFFAARLMSADGASARSYLEGQRGLGQAAWARWGLGYAPDDWRQLLEHLKSAGFSAQEIIDAGLAKVSEKGGEPYDVFRNRLMFPITDTKGDVIAFGGRALDPEDKAKYLNSPETDLFHKSHILYNYKGAREAIGYGARGGLVVCEGYMDVIAMGEAGFANAVAPLGTALTAEQLALLWRAGPDPIMCFDGDSAGIRAAHRAVDVAIPQVLPDRSVYFTFLPDGQDPDDLLKREGGVTQMRGLLENALPLVEVLWRRERDAEPLETPEQKAGLEARLKDAAGRIGHEGVRAAYRRDLLQKMREHLWQLRQTSRSRRAPGTPSDLKINTRPPPALGQLARAAMSPDLVDCHSELLASAEFGHPVSDAICDAILEVHCDRQTIDPASVAECLAARGEREALEAFEAYPAQDEVLLGSQAAREWELLIRLHAKGDVREPASEGEREALTRDPQGWAAVHRDVAERRRLRSQSSEAQMAAFEAAKKRVTEP